jgi:hypothetical protein
MKRIALLVLAMSLFAAAGTGCTPKVVGLRSDPSFNWNALSKGKLLTGGVASVSGDVSETERSYFSEIFKAQLIEVLPQLHVSPAGEVINQLGKEKYSKMLSDYQSSGEIAPIWLSELKSKLPGRTYIAFARVESNELDKNRESSYGYDKNGNKNLDSEKMTCSVTRMVTVKMDIYDLAMGLSVWSGSLSDRATRTSSYSVQKDGLVMSIVKVAHNVNETADQKYPYPEAAKTSEILSSIFRGFAKNLPKAD